jgi:beta-lactamase superfamily II metal-dependent hydrolase
MSPRCQLDRRTLLKSLACASAVSACGLAFADSESARLHGPLPAWTVGHFDIHHIDTARGNSTLLIFPDGTTMMIDAGAVTDAPAGTTNRARPNDSRRPGEWIAIYAAAHTPAKRLDYFLATHIHPDHVVGLADVDALLPITTFIDRGFPNYAPTQLPLKAPFAQAYLDFLRSRAVAGAKVEAAQVGSTQQIGLRKNPARFANFAARILSANGNIWSSSTHAVEAHLGSVTSSTTAHGNENLFSIATRFTYGAFSYFTGGDLDADTNDGRFPELDIETPVARAAGRTEVAVANHHGYFDACGPAFTNALDAQAYIIPAWDIGHPGSAQMQRMLGAWDSNNSKATHDVFTLELLPQNALLNRRFASQLKSQQGHVVVRVVPGGGTYSIYTLDSTTENGNITGVFGPYHSRT